MFWIPIVLSVSEMSFTIAKSTALQMRYFRACLLFFLIESSLGITLTTLFSLSLFRRQILWPAYPIVATVLACLFELSVIGLELFALFSIRTILRPNEEPHVTDVQDLGVWRRLTRLMLNFLRSTGMKFTSYFRDSSVSDIVSLVGYLVTLITTTTILLISRRKKERSGDQAVEIVIVVCLSLALVTCLYFSLFVIWRKETTSNSGEVRSELFLKLQVHSSFLQFTAATSSLQATVEGFVVVNRITIRSEGDIWYVILKRESINFDYYDEIKLLRIPTHIFSSPFIVTFMAGCVITIAATVVTFRREIYVDAGVFSVLFVLIPGSWSCTCLSWELRRLRMQNTDADAGAEQGEAPDNASSVRDNGATPSTTTTHQDGGQ